MRLKPVNLIPKEILKKPLAKQFLIMYKKSSIVRNCINISLLMLLIAASQYANLAVARDKVDISKQNMKLAKAKLNRLQSQCLELENEKTVLSKEQYAMKQKLDLLATTMSDDRKYFKLLALITELMPQDLWIDRFVLTEAEVQISGSTFNNELITQFVEKIGKSEVFKNSRFISSEKQILDSRTVYTFQVSAEPVWGNRPINFNLGRGN